MTVSPYRAAGTPQDASLEPLLPPPQAVAKSAPGGILDGLRDILKTTAGFRWHEASVAPLAYTAHDSDTVIVHGMVDGRPFAATTTMRALRANPIDAYDSLVRALDIAYRAATERW